MNKDFRVSITIATHHKTKKLMRRLGDRSFYNLIRLWAYTAANKPNGILLDMTEEDIEIAADWNGQCSKFILALLELKFLNKNEGVYSIHDWKEHNGYAFYADARSAKAKNAAKKRWEKQNKNKGLMLNDATSIATSIGKQCPSPSPSPSPDPSLKTIYTLFLAEWNKHKIIVHKKITAGTDTAIKKALKDYSQNEIFKAFQNYKKVISGAEYFFNYKWTLKDFLNRGLQKFIDAADPLSNYEKNKNKPVTDGSDIEYL